MFNIHKLTVKKILTAAVAAVCAGTLLVGTSACSRSSSSSSDGGDKVALLVSTMNNPFFVDLRDGAQEEADRLGVDLLISDAQNDSTTQQNQAQNAQSQGAKAVIINPVDSDAATAAVTPLLSADIPVISVDRAVTDADVTSYIASNNIEGSEKAADELAKAIDERGDVIVLEGIPGAASTRDRESGFVSQIAKYPNIRVVGKQTANFDRSEALDVATNLLQSNPNVVGIYAENDEMALGAVQALGDRAGKDVQVIGFDGTDDGFEAVEDGTMYATIAQQPKLLGQRAVEAAVKAIKGENVEKSQAIEVQVVNKENVGDYK